MRQNVPLDPDTGLHDFTAIVYILTDAMTIVKPRTIISGFYAETDAPELAHLGEQWAPQDYEISRHAHPVWEFYLQLHGHSVWRDANGGRFVCRPGAFYAPPPGLPHWLERASEGKHHFYFAAVDVRKIVASRLQSQAKVWDRRNVVYVARGGGCEESFRALIREATSDRPFRDEGVRVALDRLVLDVSRLLVGSDTQDRSLLAGHPAVDVARRAIDENPQEPWTLDTLGAMTGVSPNHLAALFTAEVGQSPHRYLLARRVNRARDLLKHSDASITTIAIDLGFNSSQHFARVFRATTGKSASAFRRR